MHLGPCDADQRRAVVAVVRLEAVAPHGPDRSGAVAMSCPPPPNGERLTDFEARVIEAWDEMLTSYAGRHILIVGHAGQMRMVIRHLLGMPLDHMFRLQIPNAGISRIEVDGEGGNLLPRLIFHAGSL